MKLSSNSNTQPLNPWNYKPWWCQPWSILLTGISLIGGSWVLFKVIWLTLLVAIPIGAWMGFFLLIWPRLVVAQYSSSIGNSIQSPHD